MKKKLLGSIVLAAVMLASGVSYHAYRAVTLDRIGSGPIRLYKRDKDRNFVEKLFKNNFHTLTANPDHDFDVMLEKRSPNKFQTKYFGKMDTMVMYEGDQPAGFISFFMKSTYKGKILFLAIDDKFRHKGYGKKLVEYALAKLKKQGAKVVKIATRTNNIPAQKLYGTKLGFVKTGEKDGFVFYRKDV